MLGAVLGDRIGAPFRFHPGSPEMDFPLITVRSRFSQISVMTMGVAQGVISGQGMSREEKEMILILTLQRWGKRYPFMGYGQKLRRWLEEEPVFVRGWETGEVTKWSAEPSRQVETKFLKEGVGKDNRTGDETLETEGGDEQIQPALWVSSLGWLYESLEETRESARAVAKILTPQEEAIRECEAVAGAIFLAREKTPKEEIRSYLQESFHVDLTGSCEETRLDGSWKERFGSVPFKAFAAFWEEEGFEKVIRRAVCLGGDGTALASVAGALAEAYYGVSEELKQQCLVGMSQDMKGVWERFLQVRREPRG